MGMRAHWRRCTRSSLGTQRRMPGRTLVRPSRGCGRCAVGRSVQWIVTPAPAPNPNPNPTPAPSPAPDPLTSATELASMILSAIGADLVAGDTEAQLKADIQSILDAN